MSTTAAGSQAAPMGEGAVLEARPAGLVPATGVAALGLGVLGDVLFRAPGPPGAGFALWVGCVAAAVVLLARRWRPLTREAALLLAGAVAFAAALAWRDAPALKLLDVACAAGLLALVAAPPRRSAAWLGRGADAGVLEYGRALLAAGLSGAFGAIALAADPAWRDRLAAVEGSRRRAALALLRGLALALPVLALFGALLASADAVFAQLLGRTFRVDLDLALGHLLLTGVLAWLAGGYLREHWAGAPAVVDAVLPEGVRPRLGIVELAVPLALLDLLFGGFVAVQVHYFFGGAATVQATAGLTFAEYARQGFFQLVAVAALVLPLLLGADALLERRRPGDVWIFRGLAALQLALVLAIVASALQRMRLYQAAFGLTELRLYTTAFMLWITACAVWLGTTVLAGRRRRFMLGAMVSGLAVAGALNVLNPDGLIVQVNLARARGGEVGAGGAGGAAFDAAYAAHLSGDAVPALVRWLAAAPPAARCPAERILARRWLGTGPRSAGDWRAWSLGSARGRTAARALLGTGALARECPAPVAQRAGS